MKGILDPVCIILPFPPSQNGLFVNAYATYSGKTGRYKSKQYKAWITEAGWELQRQYPHLAFAEPVTIDIRLQPPDKRRRDADNYAKAPVDLLVRHGILMGDDRRYVRNVNTGWVVDECLDPPGAYISFPVR